MNQIWISSKHWGLGFVALVLLSAMPQLAAAQNAQFQAFFFDACVNPVGSLAVRCGETPGGTGNLSGDSESSLNPSQALAINQNALAGGLALNEEVRELLENRRDERAREGEGSEPAGDRTWWDTAHLSLITNGGVTWFDRDKTGKERGYDGHTWNLQVGGDAFINDRLLLGALFTYENTDSEFDGDKDGVNFVAPRNDGDTDSEGYLLSFFGSYDLTEAWYVDGSAAFGWTEYDLRRHAAFQESDRTIPQTNFTSGTDDTDGYQIAASAGGGYRFARGPVSLSPYVRVGYVRTEIDGYDEGDPSGSGLAMRIQGHSQTSVISAVGVRGGYSISTPWGVIVPQARFEWEHEYDRDREKVTSRYLLDGNGTRYGVQGNAPDRDYLNVGASVMMVLPNGWIPYLDYEGLVGHSYYERNQLTGGVRVEF